MSKYKNFFSQVMEAEARGILETIQYVDLDPIIDEILICKGKIVLTGVGKSGIIARKISATMSSLSVSSYFLHPVEAVHGDIGNLKAEDLLIMLSNSGESEELIHLIPPVKEISCKLVVITAKIDSSISRAADIVITIPPLKEADPFYLVPSVSTTAMLALGDAIAITIMQLKKFNKEDFSINHPAGSIGKRLSLKVKDIMKTTSSIPVVYLESTVQDAIFEISKKGLGATLVTNELNILGIITDGDIRRSLEKNNEVWSLNASEIMTRTPTTIEESKEVIKALEIMEMKKITVLPVVNSSREITGIIHLHQILQIL
ncbi:SIS domain-containing protein [Paenibacillus sp. GCM10023248]|uniref:KpsF/GutQ family sugar-phosphate isomerase n=1 Tax=unclassified Paenibacillus TaxID=185978 RepID=UPI00237859A0|nr:KpsF/GutQ family sugar-phosphate isomerase [Paenibacillus sp. MAHUQ-63]MDD9266616.1 KpsF/GutQ family sugar-phosphate isomerase [Paenibacillus sp. MAHUQ-63]